MRIAIDVSVLDRPYATGVENALLQLLRCLQQLPEDHAYFLVAPKRPWLLPRIDDPRFRELFLSAGRRPLLWRERLVPALAHRERLDLWHAPVQAIPLLLDRPKVATLHELSWLETRQVQDEGPLHQRRMVTYVVSKAADRIIAVSERTRSNFLRLHPSAAAKCLVVHHGVAPSFFAAVPDRERLAQAYGLPAQAPWLLTLGRAFKRKGLPHAVRALRVLLDQTDGPWHMVMAGPRNARLVQARMLAIRLGLGDRVHLPGYIREEDLPALYASSDAFLMPSESEGFGIPVLEAMAAGTPVVASARAALPEICGEAARLVDFTRPLDTAMAIAEVLGAQREQWVRRGRNRARAFPEDGPARRLLSLWQELAG